MVHAWREACIPFLCQLSSAVFSFFFSLVSFCSVFLQPDRLPPASPSSSLQPSSSQGWPTWFGLPSIVLSPLGLDLNLTSSISNLVQSTPSRPPWAAASLTQFLPRPLDVRPGRLVRCALNSTLSGSQQYGNHVDHGSHCRIVSRCCRHPIC